MDRASHLCPVCSLTFSRSSHLQRHYDTHTTHKAWKCDFCGSQFKRGDALRKHWKGCSLRKLLGEAIPAQLPPGRRRRACDRCAANKQGCDQKVPCGNCATRSETCSYVRASSISFSWNDISNPLDVETWNFQFTPTTLGRFPAVLSTKRNEQRLRIDYGCRSQDTSDRPHSRTCHFQIDFIIRLANSSGLYHVFNYSSPDEHAQSMIESSLFESLIDWQETPWLDTDLESFDDRSDPSAIPTSLMASWISHPLFSQSASLWGAIQENPLFTSSIPAAPDAQSTQDCSYIEFFNPFNLEKYLRLFWGQWSLHCPIIHKPSFDIKDTPTFMILVMVLIGCLMSNNTEDASNARKWLEVAEWTVFQHMSLWSTFAQSSGEDFVALSRDKLRLLQSALLVCTVQRWEGLKESKERIRDQRFPAVVAAARDLGFDRATHSTDLDLDQKYIDWPRYILTEELIRTHTYIFLFDNQYAIFHGIPPRIKLSELNMILPYPEPCFRASTGRELLLILQELGHSSIRNKTIRNLVELLCSEHDHHAKLQDMAGMSVLGPVTLVVGQYSLCAPSLTLNADVDSI
ncbi:hypothetical protein SVAN01_02662 [Stagonosporopsis vannaccii]|nr:hypothetical protein SVAN01_02662 [Stagonosporopsis vannaccii]